MTHALLLWQERLRMNQNRLAFSAPLAILARGLIFPLVT